MFVVLVSASIVPILTFFLKILTDEAFPKSVRTYALAEFDYTTMMQTGLKMHSEFRWKNETANDNGTLVELPFSPKNSLVLGVIGVLAICIPFVGADYAMGI